MSLKSLDSYSCSTTLEMELRLKKIMKWFIFVLVFTFSTHNLIRGIQILHKNPVKVTNRFYGGFGKCFLSKFDVIAGVNPRIACVSICQRTKNCWLVCIEGRTCNLYEAYIAPYYDADLVESEGPEQENAPGVCYSISVLENDITNSIASVNASVAYINPTFTNLAINAVDGFICDRSFVHYYNSYYIINPYYEARFPFLVKVSQVLVRFGNTNLFTNIEARVGNETDVTNFNLNAKLGDTFISGPSYGWAVFDGSTNPIIGSNIILKRISILKEYFRIQELKVIGQIMN